MVSIVVFIISWDWRLVPAESNGGFCTKAKLLGLLSANTVEYTYVYKYRIRAIRKLGWILDVSPSSVAPEAQLEPQKLKSPNSPYRCAGYQRAIRYRLGVYCGRTA